MIGTFIRPPFRHLKVGGRPNHKIEQGYLHAERSIMFKAHRWHELVEEYSGLKISFQKDTLPALAGLARQMHRYREGDIYIAGMCNETMEIDMLWSAEDDLARRPDEWRGPTYSWVSTMSAVNYQRANYYSIVDVYPKVVDGNVRVSGLDPYGAVMHPCWLEIKGIMFEAILRYAAPEESQTKFTEGGVLEPAHYEIHVNGSMVGSFDADYDLKTARGGDETPVADGFGVDLLLMAKTDNNYLYLVLIRVFLCFSTVEEIDRDGELKGTNVRERIGLLSVTHYRNTVLPIHETMDPLEEVIMLK